jgi:hypothetical protein
MRTGTPTLVLTVLLFIATTACNGSPTQPPMQITRSTPPTPQISLTNRPQIPPTNASQIPPTNLVGSYRLTIAASGSCPTLPAIARRLAYDAVIAVTNGALSAQVSTNGAVTPPDVRLSGTTVSMSFGYIGSTGFKVGNKYDCPDADNQPVSDTETVSLCGTATAQFDAAAMTGAFDGNILYAEWAPFAGDDHDWRVVRWLECSANDHRFSLIRVTQQATRRR